MKASGGRASVGHSWRRTISKPIGAPNGISLRATTIVEISLACASPEWVAAFLQIGMGDEHRPTGQEEAPSPAATAHDLA